MNYHIKKKKILQCLSGWLVKWRKNQMNIVPINMSSYIDCRMSSRKQKSELKVFFFRVSYKRFFFNVSCSKITSAPTLLVLISLQNKWTNFGVFIYLFTRRQIIDVKEGSDLLQTCNLNMVHDFHHVYALLYFNQGSNALDLVSLRSRIYSRTMEK